MANIVVFRTMRSYNSYNWAILCTEKQQQPVEQRKEFHQAYAALVSRINALKGICQGKPALLLKGRGHGELMVHAADIGRRASEWGELLLPWVTWLSCPLERQKPKRTLMAPSLQIYDCGSVFFQCCCILSGLWASVWWLYPCVRTHECVSSPGEHRFE